MKNSYEPYESVTTEIPPPEFGSCALIQDLLPLYLEGEVSPGSRDTIVEHLARCERCASFLAGAQSVRAQLRRERTARDSVVARDQPTRQALSARQGVASMLALLILCTLGGTATLLLGIGLDERPSMFPAGALLGLLATAGLIALARRQGGMSLPRWIVLLASIALGVMAVAFIAFSHQFGIALLGMLLLALAVSGVWTSVFQNDRVVAG